MHPAELAVCVFGMFYSVATVAAALLLALNNKRRP